MKNNFDHGKKNILININ